MSDRALMSIDMQVLGSDRRGRVFLAPDCLPQISLEKLRWRLSESFVEEDDVERLELLERAVKQPVLAVETYPGVVPARELHAYVHAPHVSDDPIFACVIAPLDSVYELMDPPPHLVVETSALQVLEGRVSNASVVAAMESWVNRLWPTMQAPTIQLTHRPARVEAADARSSSSSDVTPQDRTGRPITVGDHVIWRDQIYTIKAFGEATGIRGSRTIVFEQPLHVPLHEGEILDELSVYLVKSSDRGLDLAKDYLSKIIVGIDFPKPTREQGLDLGAAIDWICHKQAVEDRRLARWRVSIRATANSDCGVRT